MLTSASLRNLTHTLSLLIDKAVKDGYERTMLTSAILFGFISQRIVARNVGCSHQTVGRITQKLLAMALPLPNFDEIEGKTLLLVFYPHYKKRINYKRRPPIIEMEKEALVSPKKYRLKLMTMYLLYRAKEPATALSYSRYCALWAQHCKNSKLEFRITYQPGEVLSCDYAGIVASYTDRRSGKAVKLYMFVAVLGHSKYMFAYLTKNLTAKAWVEGLVKAIHFFKGSPAVIHFDNAAMVNISGLIAELHEQAQVFSRYYNNVCDTSRPLTPKDNPNAEKQVQHIQNRVLLLLRREKFYSRDEANAYLIKKVEALNHEPMQKTKVSRHQNYVEKELPALNAIPEIPYQPYDERFKQKSSAGYTVTYNTHEYSVPYKHRNTYLTLQVSGDTLVVLHELQVLVTHQLSNEKGGRTILPTHMPPNHFAEINKNETEFIKWAESIGESVVAIVKQQYGGMKSHYSRPAGKRCITLKKFAKKFGEEELELGCAYALNQEMHTPSDIQLILKSRIYEDEEEPLLAPLIASQQNIRGKSYYEGFHHE
jgi:transposase